MPPNLELVAGRLVRSDERGGGNQTCWGAATSSNSECVSLELVVVVVDGVDRVGAGKVTLVSQDDERPPSFIKGDLRLRHGGKQAKKGMAKVCLLRTSTKGVRDRLRVMAVLTVPSIVSRSARNIRLPLLLAVPSSTVLPVHQDGKTTYDHDRQGEG